MFKLLKFFLPIVLLASCSSKSEKNLVLVSVAPYQKIVEKLVDGFAKVEVVVPKKTNLHLFNPKPSDMKQLVGAKVWFGTGELFEAKLLPALKQHSQIHYVNLSKSVTLRKESEGLCKAGHDHHHMFDLHIWMNPLMMRDQVSVIASALTEIYPDHVGEIEARARELRYDLERLDARISHRIAPFAGQSILLAHPSMGYYCAQYGLKQMSLECEGKEPSPKDIERLLAALQHTKLRCAFTQVEFNSKALIKLAQDLSTPIYSLDVFDPDYFKNMMKISDDIAQ